MPARSCSWRSYARPTCAGATSTYTARGAADVAATSLRATPPTRWTTKNSCTCTSRTRRSRRGSWSRPYSDQPLAVSRGPRRAAAGTRHRSVAGQGLPALPLGQFELARGIGGPGRERTRRGGGHRICGPVRGPGHGRNRVAVDPGAQEIGQVLTRDIACDGDEVFRADGAAALALRPRPFDRAERLVADLLLESVQDQRTAAVHVVAEETEQVILSRKRHRSEVGPVLVRVGVLVAHERLERGEPVLLDLPGLLLPSALVPRGVALVEPDVAPAPRCDTVAEPLVRQLMHHDRLVEP